LIEYEIAIHFSQYNADDANSYIEIKKKLIQMMIIFIHWKKNDKRKRKLN